MPYRPSPRIGLKGINTARTNLRWEGHPVQHLPLNRLRPHVAAPPGRFLKVRTGGVRDRVKYTIRADSPPKPESKDRKVGARHANAGQGEGQAACPGGQLLACSQGEPSQGEPLRPSGRRRGLLQGGARRHRQGTPCRLDPGMGHRQQNRVGTGRRRRRQAHGPGRVSSSHAQAATRTPDPRAGLGFLHGLCAGPGVASDLQPALAHASAPGIRRAPPTTRR